MSFGEDDKLITELQKYTKGFFFVRQKRIPTILAQGCTIGKTKNAYGNIPVLSLGNDEEGVVEGFLSDSNHESIDKDSNPFLIKKWIWRYPKYHSDGTTLTYIDDEKSEDATVTYPLTDGVNPIIWKDYYNKGLNEYNRNLYIDGDRVKSKYRTSDRVGDPIYGYWDYLGDDEDTLNTLKEQLGDYFRVLSPTKLSVNSDNYEIKGAIVPEAELRESLFN
jgi:hypothetical protein